MCRGRLGDGHDVRVYLGNDAKGRARHDAVRLLDRLGISRNPHRQ